MNVTFPCVLLLLDIWPLGRWQKALSPSARTGDAPDLFRGLWLLAEKLPRFALAAGDCYITVYGQDKGVALHSLEGLPMDKRVLNAIESVGEYLRQTFWPTGLAPFYYPPHIIDYWPQEFWVKFGLSCLLLVAVT